MNDLEMELQTIRQKLQTLKASPPETVAAPWGQSRQAAPSPNLVQVTTAIKTLRQRSEQPQPAPAPDSHLQQFDQALATIEDLAQRQQAALRHLQLLGNDLTQQIQPGQSPDVDDIARFLAECQTIAIPTVQRDANGYLDLDFRTVNFRQAEHDASSNAETLRLRSPLFRHPLSPTSGQPEHPGFDDRHHLDHSSNGLVEELRNLCQLAYRSIRTWAQSTFPSSQRSRPQKFTLLDGAIWCIGAIIIRIILNQIFQIYPALWTPIAVMLIIGVMIGLYSSIVSPRPNPVVGYRTLMSIVGLLIGGRFL